MVAPLLLKPSTREVKKAPAPWMLATAGMWAATTPSTGAAPTTTSMVATSAPVGLATVSSTV